MLRNHNYLLTLLTICTFSSTFAQESRPMVVATASMMADMTEIIGGEFVQVQCVVPIGGDPHIYEPTPGDAQMIARADLIIRNGLTFEGWLDELIENSGSNAEVITVTEGIAPIRSLVYHNATDPHAWMDVSNGLTYIRNIKDALIHIDPDNQKTYEENYLEYSKKLKELDQYIADAIATIPENKRILITSHDAFQYYGRRYGIRLESVIGASTDAEVQTADIVRLNKVIKESGVPALFVESTINPKILEQLAADNRLRIGGKLYSDSIGAKDSPAPSYYDMLKHNTDVIVAALTATTKYEDQKKSGATNTMYIYLLIGAMMLFFLVAMIIKFNR